MCTGINQNIDVIWTVYMHKNKVNGKMYIGITSRPPETRWGNNGSQYTSTKNPCFHNAIKKYGWDNFEHIILFENLTEQEAKFKERELITKYHTCVYDDNKMGYNMTFGGDGTVGVYPSEETRRKMSESKMGDKNSFYGKHHTDDTKNKMSRYRKGTNIGVSNPFYGKTHSKETKEKLSAYASTRTGDKNPNAKPIYCYETNKVYPTMTNASNELNINIVLIRKYCNGTYGKDNIKGYHFRYATEEEKCKLDLPI